MPEMRYRLSFSVGGLLEREAGIAAAEFQQLGDWALVCEALNEGNLLQARTISSGRRLAREVVQRLSELRGAEIELLFEGTQSERSHLMWVAVCRRYDLIGEFAEEVLRERFLILARSLDHDDFDQFMRQKEIWHEELADLAGSTYRKLRSNLFLMLHESGMLDEAGGIVPVVLTGRTLALLNERDPSDVRFFPTSELADHGGL